jgi:glutamate 5-kinase
LGALIALEEARLIVVKVGSALIAGHGAGALDRAWLAGVADDVARMRSRGQGVVIVSSGAVALGRGRLGFGRKKLTLAEKQAAAASGQSALMRAWEEALEPRGLLAAQILLTPDDTEVRRRFLNARNTLATLIDLGVTPVVNENDTVATQELRYGDNDRLAARVAQMAGADLLVLLSDIDGLYTADPKRDTQARHVPLVKEITLEIEAMAGPVDAKGVGSGGMATKLAAARIAASAGCATLITLGYGDAPLAAVERGGRCTLFSPQTTPTAAYKSWIAGALTPLGALIIDAGAAAALRRGKSLLAAGVRSVEGQFGKGDAVVVRDLDGREIGRGLSRYDAADASRIVGLRSDGIAKILGDAAGPMVHADDLALSRSMNAGG